MSLPAGLGSKDPLVDDQTMQTCWGGYLRAHRSYWGPEVLINSHQIPLVGGQAWEASYHLFTAQPQLSPSHREMQEGVWTFELNDKLLSLNSRFSLYLLQYKPWLMLSIP